MQNLNKMIFKEWDTQSILNAYVYRYCQNNQNSFRLTMAMVPVCCISDLIYLYGVHVCAYAYSIATVQIFHHVVSFRYEL